MQGFILTAIAAAEKCTLILDDIKFGQSEWSKVKGTRSRYLLKECVKDNYYARFHPHS